MKMMGQTRRRNPMVLTCVALSFFLSYFVSYKLLRNNINIIHREIKVKRMVEDFEPAKIPTEYLIEEEDFCKRNDLEIIVYVHSAISNIYKRNVTRHTWGNGSKNNIPLTVVFMVGRAKNETEVEIVREESKMYHDIIQGDYIDGYQLLTYKALNALNWVSKNCANVPWTMHADDDIMVNTFRLMKRLKIIESDEKERSSFYCNVFPKAVVLRKGKWKVSFEKYRPKYYPIYCQGPMWLLRTKDVEKLLDAVERTQFWWIDDLYITGFLAMNANVSQTHIPYLQFDKEKKIDMLNKIAWLSVGEDRYEWWKNISAKWIGA